MASSVAFTGTTRPFSWMVVSPMKYLVVLSFLPYGAVLTGLTSSGGASPKTTTPAAEAGGRQSANLREKPKVSASCVGSAKRARLRDTMPVAPSASPWVKNVWPQVNKNAGAVASGPGAGRKVVGSDSTSVMMLPAVLTLVAVFLGNSLQVSLRQPADGASRQVMAQPAFFRRRQDLAPHRTPAYDEDTYPASQSTQSMVPARSSTAFTGTCGVRCRNIVTYCCVASSLLTGSTTEPGPPPAAARHGETETNRRRRAPEATARGGKRAMLRRVRKRRTRWGWRCELVK
uniref:Uncharacterized protein n=1 Tax=Oryza meridionalis TaxID=40149 RepID=A0A0E0DR79_9ORYZ